MCNAHCVCRLAESEAIAESETLLLVSFLMFSGLINSSCDFVVEQHDCHRVQNVFSMLENDVKPRCAVSGPSDFESNVCMKYSSHSL